VRDTARYATADIRRACVASRLQQSAEAKMWRHGAADSAPPDVIYSAREVRAAALQSGSQ